QDRTGHRTGPTRGSRVRAAGEQRLEKKTAKDSGWRRSSEGRRLEKKMMTMDGGAWLPAGDVGRRRSVRTPAEREQRERVDRRCRNWKFFFFI
ncbi:hypothetical protein LINPERHAP1_LOCUS38359, partial [Linum perenne]